ncbi:MAG TPA: tetratricopeptide repeat protein [Oceanospirillales bacterium]|nr:tetratricopeptide repeat protein [Oceanospirillales bacterium]
MATKNLPDPLSQIAKLVENGQLSQAKKLCEQLTRANKKNPRLWLTEGDINQKLQLFDKAESNYRRAIKINPNSVLAHNRVAMLVHSQGKFGNAEPCYRKSLKLDDKQAIIHFNLGAVLQELGKLDDAVAQYKKAIEQKPDYAKAYANLGFIFRQQGLIEDGIESYHKALKFAPDIAEIHYNMGLSLLDTGQAEAAEQHQRQAISLKPDYADAWAGLGAVQFFNGDTENAANSYQQALDYQPNNVEILCGYANSLSALGRHEQAMEHIKQALHTAQDNTEALLAKGSIHVSLGELDEAFDCCDRVLKTEPQHEKAICLAASICEKKGDEKQAYNYLIPLLQEKYSKCEAILIFASISKSLNLVDNAIERMEQLLQDSRKIQATERRRLHFALGKAYDSQKNYDRAFQNFHKANSLKRAVFDIKSFQRDIDAQIKVFSSDFSSQLPRASIRSNRPVFIVGMPRSGTSLVEQILASHPKVSGAGELPDINNLTLSMHLRCGTDVHYPECIKQTDSQQLDSMTQSYLDCLSNIDHNASHVTDKMPGNFMHLGLIQLLFPNARIIHCIRDPLDTCLSCYFQDFSRSHPWIYDLQNTGRVYLEYQRLMQHWKNVLEIPILDVHYEKLVENQESISRQMIEFCGLEWDDACLQFHKNKRFIWTASYEQVRQPMYKKSVARWKNYEQYIKPLTEIIKPRQEQAMSI